MSATVGRWIWIAAGIGLALWSLLAWGTFALVTGGGAWLAANADLLALHPDWAAWLQWTVRVAQAIGVWVIWVVWALGAVTVVGGAALLRVVMARVSAFGGAARTFASP